MSQFANSKSERAINVGVVMSSVSRNAGGVFDAVRLACQQIVQGDDINIEVFGVRDDRTDKDLSAWSPLKVSAFDRIGPRALAHAPELGKAVQRAKHLNIVHQHGIWQSPSRVALKWRQISGNPIIISPHGMLDPWALKNSKTKKQVAAWMFERDNLQGATCLHALNQSELDACRAYGISRPIAVIPNGVSLPTASAQVRSNSDSRGRRTLLFLGRIHRKKGLFELISAWKTLQSEARNVAAEWRLEIAGWDDGGHKQELQNLVEALDLKTEISFSGPKFGQEKEQAFQRASAFVLPSHSEGLPMAVLEAWSYKLPVFKTSACNLEVGFEQNAAIRIKPDADNIVQVLRSHLGREDLAHLGENGHQMVCKQFSWASISHQFSGVYRWMHTGAHLASRPSCVSVI